MAEQLPDWERLLAAAARLQSLRRDPEGPVASRVAELLSTRDYEESGALWSTFLEHLRARSKSAGG